MLLRFFRPFTVALMLVFVFLLPAAAQDQAAKEAWADLRSAARERGILIASQGQTDYGTSMVAQNVRIYAQDDPEAFVLNIPEIRVEPRGTAIALIPSPRFTASMLAGGGYQREFTFSHSGEIVFEANDDAISLNLAFQRLGVVLTSATHRGAPMNEALDVNFDGLRIDLQAEREGAAVLTIGAAETRYAFQVTSSAGGSASNQSGDAIIQGLRLEFTGAELDMLSGEAEMLRPAFEAGLRAHLLMATESGSGTSTQDFGSGPVTLTSRYGVNEFTIDLADGALTLETHARDMVLQGGMGPMTGGLSLGAASMSLGFPMLATPDDQTVYYRFSLDDVLATPETLQLIGAQEFAGEPITLGLDISAQGRLTRDFGPEFGSGGEPPFDLTSVSLDRLLTRVGTAELSGTGAFSFLGGLMASIGNGIPNGTGDFVFDLIGGDAFLTRLSALGIVPQDQQFFARMMMNGLGRSIGEDHLRSEVAIRPGGVITVNGAPLPF